MFLLNLKTDYFYDKNQQQECFFKKVLMLNTFSKAICVSYKKKPFFFQQARSEFLRINKPILKKMNFTYSVDYLDTYNKIETFRNDSIFNYIKPKKGYSFPLKEKYFINKDVVQYDFKEKFYSYRSYSKYLGLFFKNINRLEQKNKNYFYFFPLKIQKGGAIAMLMGFVVALSTKTIFTKTANNIFGSKAFPKKINPFYENSTVCLFYAHISNNYIYRILFGEKLKKTLTKPLFFALRNKKNAIRRPNLTAK